MGWSVFRRGWWGLVGLTFAYLLVVPEADRIAVRTVFGVVLLKFSHGSLRSLFSVDDCGRPCNQLVMAMLLKSWSLICT